jgi:hypothetical protein
MASLPSLEMLLRGSARALVIGVGGGGDVVGALVTARLLEFCGVDFRLGGLSWERWVIDPLPGPRSLAEVEDVKVIHPRAWLANPRSRTKEGAYFAESKMAEIHGRETLLVDINGGVQGVVAGLEAATAALGCDLLVGVDVGGDSLAQGEESGLRSPLADSIMLAAYAELAERGRNALWALFGYGSDGELDTDEIELALSKVARAGGLLGAWGLTQAMVAELERVIREVETEASAVPVDCARGAWGEKGIRHGERRVKLTPLATLTFFLSPLRLYESLSKPAQAVRSSASLEEANDALHKIGLKTELDREQERYKTQKTTR